MSKPVLKASQLAKTYGTGVNAVEVLKSVDLELSPAEKVAIVGSSGSGKSTLLHLLGGLDAASAGEVELAGQLLNRMSPKELDRIRNQHLGFVYQFHHLLDELTALENVALPLRIRGLSQVEAEAPARILLDAVSLGKRLHHTPAELSGGERQRVAVARALVGKPDCVLADEPTGNLDSKNTQNVFDIFRELAHERGQTIIAVTHDEDFARNSDRVIDMSDGLIV